MEVLVGVRFLESQTQPNESAEGSKRNLSHRAHPNRFHASAEICRAVLGAIIASGHYMYADL